MADNVVTRAMHAQHKCGIEVSSSVKHAHDIDRKSSNEFWRNWIEKENHAVGVVFEILNENDKVPYGRQINWTPYASYQDGIYPQISMGP